MLPAIIHAKFRSLGRNLIWDIEEYMKAIFHAAADSMPGTCNKSLVNFDHVRARCRTPRILRRQAEPDETGMTNPYQTKLRN